MGIRASAPLAFHAADPARADALWLWLPVVDGCAHVQSLEAQDLEARTDPHRYPLRALPVPAEREELVGFRTSAGFRRDLASRCPVAGGPRLPIPVVTSPGTVLVAFADAVPLVLLNAAADRVR